MRTVRPSTVLILLVPLLLPACVKKSTHQATLAELADARDEGESLRAEMQRHDAEARARASAEAARRDSIEADLERQIAELQAEVARRGREIERLEDRRDEVAARFDEARAEVDRLEVLLNQRGTEYRQLQQRLQSLAAIEREVRERNQIYQDVLGRFRSLIDGGQLTVKIDRGRMVIQLPQDILFQSGSATLAQDGRRTLIEVAAVLKELSERKFQVEGHTDNVPISTERFPSNWELSSARALSVVRLLVDQGVPGESISGAAFGEFQPVAPNDTRESRRLNRRIEIVMLPNLDVIASAQIPG